MSDNAWGKEPFDLRLTVLRMLRSLPGILLVTALITLLLGGGYFLKNVTFRQRVYIAATTLFVEYADEDWATNGTYVNEYTWNAWLTQDEYTDRVLERLGGTISKEKLEKGLSAKVPSDLRMVTISFGSTDKAEAERVIKAAGDAMAEDFAKGMKDVAAIRVTDVDEGAENLKTIKPVRAIILSAVIGIFTAVMLFLLKELIFERIWLPEELTRRFGIKNAGLPGTDGEAANLAHFFEGKTKVAICPATAEVDSKALATKLSCKEALKSITWIAEPAPLLSPESARSLKEADGVLLAVNAGEDVKKLQLTLDFLAQQGVTVTASLLCEEDAWLLRCYYALEAKE